MKQGKTTYESQVMALWVTEGNWENFQHMENEIKFGLERNLVLSNETQLTAMVIPDMYHQVWQASLSAMAIFPTWGMQNKVIDNYYAFMLMKVTDQRPRKVLSLFTLQFFLSLGKSQERKCIYSQQKKRC